MSPGALGSAAAGAVSLVLSCPYLARLTLTVPDRDAITWWWGPGASARRTAATGALGAVLGGLAGYAAGWTAVLAAFLVLAFLCVPLAVIDVEHHRLPDRLVFTAGICGAVLLGLASIAEDDAAASVRALAAAALIFGVFFLMTLLAPFGFGDTKLATVLAAYLGWFGWDFVLYGILAGFLFASLFVLPMVLLRRASLKTMVPFGPALILGALLVAAFRLVPSTSA